MSRREGGLKEVKARADMYAFLSSLFLSEPEEGQVKGLREIFRILKMPHLNSFTLEELKREYFDLFVIPNPRYVRPYESVFMDRIPIEFAGIPEQGVPPATKYIKGLLMGESARGVIKFYQQEGVYPERELPDHIGNELSFLAYLVIRESESSGDETIRFRKLQEDFKKRHVLRWIGRLGKIVAKHDKIGYYKNAVSVTHILLNGFNFSEKSMSDNIV